MESCLSRQYHLGQFVTHDISERITTTINDSDHHHELIILVGKKRRKREKELWRDVFHSSLLSPYDAIVQLSDLRPLSVPLPLDTRPGRSRDCDGPVWYGRGPPHCNL